MLHHTQVAARAAGSKVAGKRHYPALSRAANTPPDHSVASLTTSMPDPQQAAGERREAHQGHDSVQQVKTLAESDGYDELLLRHPALASLIVDVNHTEVSPQDTPTWIANLRLAELCLRNPYVPSPARVARAFGAESTSAFLLTKRLIPEPRSRNGFVTQRTNGVVADRSRGALG